MQQDKISFAVEEALHQARTVTRYTAYLEHVKEIRGDSEMDDKPEVHELCSKLLGYLDCACCVRCDLYSQARQQVPNFADLYETPKTDEERAAVATLLWKMRSKKQD